MKLQRLALTAAAAALMASPVIAQAEPVRAPAPVSAEDEGLGGGGMLIALLVFAAVSALFIVLYNDDNEPVSP